MSIIQVVNYGGTIDFCIGLHACMHKAEIEMERKARKETFSKECRPYEAHASKIITAKFVVRGHICL